MEPAWYETFFTHLPNEFWRRAAPGAGAAEDVTFFLERFGITAPARVVDVPCGSGRHCLALAARGHRVTGYDLSAEAIEHARALAAQTGLDVALRRAEMRQVPQDGAADLALCLGNSIGYLPERELRVFLGALAGAVRPGGGLGFDFNATAESVLPDHDGAPRTMVAGDIEVTASASYDAPRSRLLSHYRFVQGSRTEEATAVHHVYTCAHLVALVEDAGFTDVECFDGVSTAPFGLGSGRLVVTAVRR
ncbi:bifunctional 2-polyprenyl-6-hydroxyphenol methylase/3-demethylubiquinol 3-O-methyltransferase UbiG [Conexibacter sp. SYSU D00693]|uniref:class I SAM-dependent methyltransferase n=1 Tax=Conexibacter sp. SYSU D00693 TaxID=2812560 RepID=UPI00196A44B1|nr:class I SAM-dependent methyltransferase [Conexibacter sp. SYSU D00693]